MRVREDATARLKGIDRLRWLRSACLWGVLENCGAKANRDGKTVRASAYHQHHRFTMNAMASVFVITDGSEPVDCGEKMVLSD